MPSHTHEGSQVVDQSRLWGQVATGQEFEAPEHRVLPQSVSTAVSKGTADALYTGSVLQPVTDAVEKVFLHW
jgi:hypothetical protein